MIEQLIIKTTKKYNFPQNNLKKTLPQCFFELSLKSLDYTQHYFQQQFQQNSENDSFHFNQFNLHPISLVPKKIKTKIAAVDTSCIKIGETNRGVLIAIRGASVLKEKRNYEYIRIGPFIFHITQENIKKVYNTLRKTYFDQEKFNRSPSFTQIPLRISHLLERWLQKSLSKTIHQGIVLFDGSLTSGIGDNSQYIKEILQLAKTNSSVILAFSKMTDLRLNGQIITNIFQKHKPPCLIEIDNLRYKPPLILFGKVYVSRLTNENYAFRLDIDKHLTSEERINAVEKLLGNDLFSQSYPETLRLSHILCTFTANEVIAIKHFISKKFGLKIIYRPNMHRLLFGRFGRGD
jgi:hypothetical protein